MYRNTKIATCSYCGTRSALVLDQGRHELVCPACGAPLHEIKAMPVKERAPRRDRKGRTGATPHKAPHQPPTARQTGRRRIAGRTGSARDGPGRGRRARRASW